MTNTLLSVWGTDVQLAAGASHTWSTGAVAPNPLSYTSLMASSTNGAVTLVSNWSSGAIYCTITNVGAASANYNLVSLTISNSDDDAFSLTLQK